MKDGNNQKHPKTDARYWRSKLFKRTNEELQVRIAYAGRQERFPLKTANRDQAAGKARDIYLSLHSGGWDATLAEFKPWTAEAEKAKDEAPTVGAFITAVKAVAPVKPTTFLTYERKFRFLVSQIKGFEGTKDRHDHFNGHSKKWRERIDGVTLDEITPEAVGKWRVQYIAADEASPLEVNSARQSAASIIRNSKALFNPKLLRLITNLKLPSPLPFDGVDLGKRPRTRYKSKVNAALIVKLAGKELRKKKPELYKIFLLAFGAGLRRGEIDKLTWSQFNWTQGTISIETTEYGDTKTEGSKEEIDMGKQLVAYFKKAFAASESNFVVTSSVDASQPHHWNHYRCNRHFKNLIGWLKSKGVESRNPIHTLRKEFGSFINKKFGIYAASAALRHSNIHLTRESYVDKKERIALDIGELLKGN